MINEYRDLFTLLMVIALLAMGAMTAAHLYDPKDN